MDFTREPIIETVITPKEGCKLVVRSSKNSGQEEYFVDAVEVVSFGNSFFFRSLERPKSFLVPSSDYEILEVREARMVLKNVGLERSIKIGGGRETPVKPIKEALPEKVEVEVPILEEAVSAQTASEGVVAGADLRVDKKRDRRRHYRRRRGREEAGSKDDAEVEGAQASEIKIELQAPQEGIEGNVTEPVQTSSVIISSILPPPPTLISETIARYKDNAMFKGAFFIKEESEKVEAPRIDESFITDRTEEEDAQGEASVDEEGTIDLVSIDEEGVKEDACVEECSEKTNAYEDSEKKDASAEEWSDSEKEDHLKNDSRELDQGVELVAEDPFSVPSESAEDRISNGN